MRLFNPPKHAEDVPEATHGENNCQTRKDREATHLHTDFCSPHYSVDVVLGKQ